MTKDASISRPVIDASAALSWLFEDERDERAIAMAAVVVREGAYAPSIWHHEVLNALLVANRRSRLTDEDLERMAGDLGSLDVDSPAPFDLAAELRIARRFRLSAYDAAYIHLALLTGSPLMTRDARLEAAAAELGILWEAKA